MRRLFLALAACLAPAAGASPYFVSMPDGAFTLVLDVPTVNTVEGSFDGQRFSFTAASRATGVTFSVHTEPMAGGDNAECRRRVWERGRRNPYVVKATVREFDTRTVAGIAHRSEGDFRGQPFTTVNAHGFLARAGRCVDVHVSRIPASDEALRDVERIAGNLSVVD